MQRQQLFPCGKGKSGRDIHVQIGELQLPGGWVDGALKCSGDTQDAHSMFLSAHHLIFIVRS
jgi:hypothetical protein